MSVLVGKIKAKLDLIKLVVDKTLSNKFAILFFVLCSFVVVAWVSLNNDIFDTTISGVGYAMPVQFAIWGVIQSYILFFGMKKIWSCQQSCLYDCKGNKLVKLNSAIVVINVVAALSIVVSTLVFGDSWSFKAIVHVSGAAMFGAGFVFNFITLFILKIRKNQRKYLLNLTFYSLCVGICLILIFSMPKFMIFQQLFVLLPSLSFLFYFVAAS